MADQNDRLGRVLGCDVLDYLDGVSYEHFLRQLCFVFAVVTAMTSEVKGDTRRVVRFFFDDRCQHSERKGRVPRTMQAQEHVSL